LFVWGKSQFLGIDLACNVFKPFPILTNFKVEDLKVNTDRIIVNTKIDNDNDIQDEEKVNLQEEEENLKKKKQEEENNKAMTIQKCNLQYNKPLLITNKTKTILKS